MFVSSLISLGCLPVVILEEMRGKEMHINLHYAL